MHDDGDGRRAGDSVLRISGSRRGERSTDGLFDEVVGAIRAGLRVSHVSIGAVARALGRARQEGRIDDSPESIARRLALYHEQTKPVVEYYRATGKLVPLHARRSIEEVSDEIEKALDMVVDAA